MKKSALVSAVVHIRENTPAIETFLETIDNFFDTSFEWYELVVVNNTQNPQIEKEIEIIASHLRKNVILVNLAWRHNPEIAMTAGSDVAVGDFIYEFDSANIDFPIELLHKLYEKVLSGYDIVSAQPNKKIRLTSKIFYRLFNKFSNLNFDISAESVRCVTRRALNSVLRIKERGRYRKALYRFSGFPYAYISYEPIVDIRLKNENSFLDRLYLAVDLFIYFSDLGLKVCLIFSLLFLLVSLAGGAYTLYIFLTLKNVVSGWTTIMIFLSFGFSGIFLILSILGKYLSAILNEILDRPRYTIYSIQRFVKNE